MQPWNVEAETAWWADTCRKSLWWFCCKAYGIASHPLGTWLDETVHRPFCDWLQHHLEDWLANRKFTISKNLMIIVPREFGKTNLVSRAALLWLQVQDPELSICIASETKEKAQKFFEPIKTVLRGKDPYASFAKLYGNWYDPDRTWRSQDIVHAMRKAAAVQDPSFFVIGVTTGATGDHPDVFDLDDPTSYEKLKDDVEWFNKVNSFCASMVPVVKKNGLNLMVGTPYGDADHLTTQLFTLGVKSVTGMRGLEIEPREDGVWDVYFLDAEKPDGSPTLPKVWPKVALENYKKTDNMKYWAQVRCQPARSEHTKIQRWQIDQLFVAPKDVPNNLRISVHIDTAFKYSNRKARGDFNVIQVWGHARDGSGDVYYLEGVGSNIWRIEQFNDQLVSILQRLRRTGKWPFVLTDELEGWGKTGSWESTLESACHKVNIPKPHTEFIMRQGRKKEVRISTAVSFWMDGKVKLVRGAPGVEELIDQMVKVDPRYDDWLDAMADVFAPQVYKPARLEHNPYDGVTPYDDVLKPKVFDLARLRKQWITRERGDNRFDPVGMDG